MKKSLAPLFLALTVTALTFAPDSALAAGKKSSKKPQETAESVAGHSPEPDVASASAVDFNCEFGSKITTYQQADDGDHMTLRWQHKLHPLTKVSTTTGATRFEDTAHGLVWIGIPSKNILLDAKSGHPLANECKSPAQQEITSIHTAGAGQG